MLTGMPGSLRVTRSIVVPEKELRWRFSRSSGPGGQSVNTADSRVQLSLDLMSTTALGPVQRARALERLAGRLVDGVLTITAKEERSQLQNREIALGRLAEILAAAVAPPPPSRRPTRPSAKAVERRIAAKKRTRPDQATPPRRRGVTDGHGTTVRRSCDAPGVFQ